MTQTLFDLVDGHLRPVLNHQKHFKPGVPKRPTDVVTGQSLLVNETVGLTVIDIDIDKTQPRSVIDQLRNSLCARLNRTVIAAKTPSGGLHCYCATGDYTSDRARKVDACIVPAEYKGLVKGVDIMSSFEPTIVSQVIYVGSVTDTGVYEWVQNDETQPVLDTVEQVLASLGFTLKALSEHTPSTVQQPKLPVKGDVQPSDKEPISEQLANALLEGIAGFTVHGTSSLPIDSESSLFTLFTGINALPDEYVDRGYYNAFTRCQLTQSASAHFNECRARYKEQHSLPNLIKTLKVHRSDYYETELRGLLQQRYDDMTSIKQDVEDRMTELESWSFNVNDGFSYQTIRAKCPYSSLADAIADLKRVFVAIDSAVEVFVIKDYGEDNRTGVVWYVSEQAAKAKLCKILVGTLFDGRTVRPMSMWDVYLSNTRLFTMERLTFYNETPGSFNLFCGYDYKQLESVERHVIKPFLDHIHDVIADGNEEVYRYVLLWIASVLQKPTYKSEVALVLLGKQGSGKNVFTNAICKLMARYANENVTSIESIVGRFNSTLESKKLIVLNELRSVDCTKHFDSDALKSLITDKRMMVEAKYEPARLVDNVANFMMCSNNRIPVRIEDRDRRYMVTETSSVHCGDHTYFQKLIAGFTPDFYENLFTYFMLLNTAGFNSRVIPSTDAKTTIQEASMSPYELFVRDSYERINEITGPDLWNLYRDYTELNHYVLCTQRHFVACMKEFTGEAHQRRVGGKNTKVYTLLPEYVARFRTYHEQTTAALLDSEYV